MRSSTFTAAASLFGLSSAFLLPPSISFPDIELTKSLTLPHLVSVDEWSVQVDYPNLPHANQAESAMEFNFTVKHNEEASDQLLLNKHIIYPLSPASPTAFLNPLTAPLLIKNDKNKWEFTENVMLGYSVNARHSKQNADKDQIQQISIQVKILEVAGVFLDRTLTIDLHLLRLPTGKLMIREAEISVPKSLMSSPLEETENCTSLLCKMKAGLSEALNRAKGALETCHMAPNFQAPRIQELSGLHPHSSDEIIKPLNIHENNQESFLETTIMPFLVPTLVGIIAGISAGLIGLFLGYLAIYIWSFWRRRNSAKYTLIDQEDNDINGMKYDQPQVLRSSPEYRDEINEKMDV